MSSPNSRKSNNVSSTTTTITTTGGVADYYAILGVGDQLQWKHSQKTNQYDAVSNNHVQPPAEMMQNESDRPTNNGDYATHASNQKQQQLKQKAEHEDERFFREIVRIEIVAFNCFNGDNSEINRIREFRTKNRDSCVILDPASTVQKQPSSSLPPRNARLETKNHNEANNTFHQLQDKPQDKVQSPSESDTDLEKCSMISQNQVEEYTNAREISTDSMPHKPLVYQEPTSEKEESFWNTLKTTLPASKEGYGIGSTSWLSSEAVNKNSGVIDNHNEVIDHTGQPELWSKDETLDANLDIFSGIRFEIQSRQSSALNSTEKGSTNATYDQNMHKQQSTTSTGLFHRKMINSTQILKRTIQKRLRNNSFSDIMLEEKELESHEKSSKPPPFDALTAEEIHSINMKNNPLGHSIYYISFQRRSDRGIKDNTVTRNLSTVRTSSYDDIPAIADVQLCYVRLHWESIPSIMRPPLVVSMSTSSSEMGEPDISCGTKGPSMRVATAAETLDRPSATSGSNQSNLTGLANQILERLTQQKSSTKQPTSSSQMHILHPKQNLSTINLEEESQNREEIVNSSHGRLVLLEDCIELPPGFDEWSIPVEYRWIHDPQRNSITTKTIHHETNTTSTEQISSLSSPSSSRSSQHPSTVQCNENPSRNVNEDILSSSISGEEEIETIRKISPVNSSKVRSSIGLQRMTIALEKNFPLLWTMETDEGRILDEFDSIGQNVTQDNATLKTEDLEDFDSRNSRKQYFFVPILAVRRQRVTDEERYHEDAAVVDVAVSFCDRDAQPVWPSENCNNDSLSNDDIDPEEDEGTFQVLGKTPWLSTLHKPKESDPTMISQSFPLQRRRKLLGMPVLLVRKNIPFGFADVAFATRVLGRFPFHNYKGLPLPEEELPMFCYPTGCRLLRARLSDAPLPQNYGFVVKNERGDSIYISCVSFFEPLAASKVKQLAEMSKKRRTTSIPHRRFWERQVSRKVQRHQDNLSSDAHHHNELLQSSSSLKSNASLEVESNSLLTGFDDMTTFENKTICLISRYPYWTAFRKWLCHLHIAAGTPSVLPLERWISHLLLSVPLPRPGGPSILIPLPTLNEPMILWQPPEKDFPLVNLPYHRLFGCLEIRTVITVVLSLLALERKVIVLSTRPSLVLDVCELLRSLLFPFELCAPYVPRLTEPFKTSLDFPGAIFVGIHDDGTLNGLAAAVRNELPEDSIVLDLDTGDIDCYGNNFEVIQKSWEIIPESERSVLLSELETLCRDAKIVDGQEALDSLLDSAFEVALPAAVDPYSKNMLGENGCVSSTSDQNEPFDDRAARDAFLRFFCSVLGGYERYLVVPDADFLVSGNEWFDSQGFLAAVSPDRAAYLSALVSTQLFQSFIQRRTEASDFHCLLFDECLIEFHSSSVPYGRLGGDVETVQSPDSSQPQMLYSLLVDQSATFASSSDHTTILANKSMDASETDSTLSITMSKASGCYTDVSSLKYAESMVNASGDLVTVPSRQGLPVRHRFIYFVDGKQCFPHILQNELLLPSEPESWILEMYKSPNVVIVRNERELDEANRRRKVATSQPGLTNQRRCLWQFPKLMGSHVLGTWLLCVPALVAQRHLPHDFQSRYLLRALGALRLLRSKQRIVPDEAAYRALMVACGRTNSDRRVELVKLFGLLRSDGIFPSSVTLGQYTRALAEGYSKRSSGAIQDTNEDGGSVEVTKTGRFTVGNTVQSKNLDLESLLRALDPSLSTLEAHGKRWRLKTSNVDNKKKKNNKTWYPVTFSSSFVPMHSDESQEQTDIRLLAIWSRTRGCTNCSYIPLDEEVQAGWDVVGGDTEIPDAVACPRCQTMIVPMLGYRELSLEQAFALDTSLPGILPAKAPVALDFESLPPQIGPLIASLNDIDLGVSYVTYVSPSSLRSSLEQYVEALGEEILDRDHLMQLEPEILINFWWYCARFSLPLPLPVKQSGVHYCAFAAWDRSVAERGCYSASAILSPLFRERKFVVDEISSRDDTSDQNEIYEEFPLMSRFNLQGFFSTVWDHEDLSKLLVTLVEACDKKDFKPVIDTIASCNKLRRERFLNTSNGGSTLDSNRLVTISNNKSFDSIGSSFFGSASSDLDGYKTILYLSKYQCTTAFQSFFPATLKPCKGYHFWCAMGTPLPIFDRLVREGIHKHNRRATNSASHNRQQQSKPSNVVSAPVRSVSDVALGFRCVFGHLI